MKYPFPDTTDYKDNNLEILKLKFCYARTDWDCPISWLSYKTSNPQSTQKPFLKTLRI